MAPIQGNVGRKSISAMQESGISTDLLRAFKTPAEIANNEARQKLQAQHKADIKQIEEDIRNPSHANTLERSARSKAQLNQLLDLLDKKAEVELNIINQLQHLNSLHEAVNKEVEYVRASGL